MRNAYLEQLQKKLSHISKSTEPWLSNQDQETANILLQKLILALPDNIVTKIDDNQYLSVKTLIIDKLLIFTLIEDVNVKDFNNHFTHFVEILVSDIYASYPQLLRSDHDAH